MTTPPLPSIRVLHLEDSARDAAALADVLIHAGLTVDLVVAGSGPEYVSALERGGWDAILTDFNLADFDGLAAVKEAKARCPQVPIIVITNTLSESDAVACLRAGAADYVLKDRLLRLPDALKRALEDRRQREENRRTAAALAATERRLKAIAAHSLILLYTRDFNGVLTYMSPQAEHFLGCPAEHTLGRRWAEFVAGNPVNRSRLESLQTALARGAVPSPVEIELEMAGDRRLTVELRETLLPGDDHEPASVAGVMVDISERKALERRLQHTQRLENLGLLSAGIAHDLNNILAPILMAGPLCRRLMSEPHDLRLIDIVENSARRGADLVKQILSFSRSGETERSVLELRPLLGEIASLVEQTFPKNLEIKTFVSEDLHTVHANPTQLHQVLLNLCVNARDAMPDGGTLSIWAENRKVSRLSGGPVTASGRSNWVALAVEDTGVGMTPAELDKIWTPFYTTKRAREGSGLGLATVRGVVAEHGGHVKVESQVGRGTRFEVLLPAVTAETEDAVPDNEDGIPAGAGECILVVDDEPLVREMLNSTLGKSGYKLVSASHGVEALTYLNGAGSDVRLLVTDVHMPHMSGDVLISVVRRMRPDIKIIAISGHPDAEKLRTVAAPDRPHGFLAKPFLPKVLYREVRRQLASLHEGESDDQSEFGFPR